MLAKKWHAGMPPQRTQGAAIFCTLCIKDVAPWNFPFSDSVKGKFRTYNF